MGDRFYNFIVFLGRIPFRLTSRPIVLHLDRMPKSGAFVLASTHTSPYDVGILLRTSPRHLDFLSITEVFSKPLIGPFFSRMNAFPLDRSRRDPQTVRVILDRLEHGRVVAMFPEGNVRPLEQSVVYGRSFRPGVARIARMTNVPIVPVVVWGGRAYHRCINLLPLRRVRYGIIFGGPIRVDDDAAGEQQLAEAYRSLFAELSEAMKKAGAAV